MKKWLLDKKQQMGVIGFIVFATMVIVAVIVFQKIETSVSVTGTQATMAKQNVTDNTYSAFNLVSVGPIIYGAVVILGIVGLLYMRRR